MRILHTSDWHLGRSLHRVDLLTSQSRFVDHVVDVVRSEAVDVVVVSGDIYDRALPPVDAVSLAHEALRRLLSVGVRVVMSSGNHDSAPRLGFAADLIDSAGIHLRTDPAQIGTPVVVRDHHGDVAIYAIPYLEPDLLRSSWRLPSRSHQAALDEAMQRVRADLATRPDTTRSVAMAHAFVIGGTSSGSERDISVGGMSTVARATFSGVDYAALGHLHGRHSLSDPIRYSGSPLAYSFSEAQHRKGSWLVELDATGLHRVDFVDAPVPRALSLVTGSMEMLLSDPSLADAERSWVHATITDPRRPPHAMERLRTRFPHALVLAFSVPGNAAEPIRRVGDRVVGRTDAEVTSSFFADVCGAVPTSEEAALLREASEACRVAEDIAS